MQAESVFPALKDLWQKGELELWGIRLLKHCAFSFHPLLLLDNISINLK
jgi:hypothetical protein